LNIRIAPVAIYAASTHCILLEVELIRIWHSIEDLSESPCFLTTGAGKGARSLQRLLGHSYKITATTDKSLVLGV
jgi:hypothetical protein